MHWERGEAVSMREGEEVFSVWEPCVKEWWGSRGQGQEEGKRAERTEYKLNTNDRTELESIKESRVDKMYEKRG